MPNGVNGARNTSKSALTLPAKTWASKFPLRGGRPPVRGPEISTSLPA